MKVQKSPWPALYPCPVTLVTTVDSDGNHNIITLAWVGVACSDPPTLSIAIRPHRYSYQSIIDSGDFVVNIPNEEILKKADLCGVISGKNIDKFNEVGLTPEPAEKVKPPIIKECPVNIECIVKSKIPLGVHDLFLGEVVRVHINQEILDQKGRIDYSKVSPVIYNQGEYWNLNTRIGIHGFSKK
jgi:flavin reductase (DIM6/NTAB) family NADH-FMN oxidoreductase RutF